MVNRCHYPQLGADRPVRSCPVGLGTVSSCSKPSRGSPDPKHPRLRPCKTTEVLCGRRDKGIVFWWGGFFFFFSIFFFFLFKVPHCLNVPTECRRACWLLLRVLSIHTSGEGHQLLLQVCQYGISLRDPHVEQRCPKARQGMRSWLPPCAPRPSAGVCGTGMGCCWPCC